MYVMYSESAKTTNSVKSATVPAGRSLFVCLAPCSPLVWKLTNFSDVKNAIVIIDVPCES
jgi:hypothetical protein